MISFLARTHEKQKKKRNAGIFKVSLLKQARLKKKKRKEKRSIPKNNGFVFSRKLFWL